MHSAVKGERNNDLENLRKTYPNVRVVFRDDHISIEGPPEDVEHVRSQIQPVIDDFKKKNTTYLEVEIDPQYYKQLIGKNQTRLLEMQEQTGCDIKFPFDDVSRLVKLVGTKENVEKAKQLLLERAKKLVRTFRYLLRSFFVHAAGIIEIRRSRSISRCIPSYIVLEWLCDL